MEHRTVVLSDGSSALEFPDTAKVSAYEYPKLNKSKPHEYVTSGYVKGKTYADKPRVLTYDQNGYKYNSSGKQIVGKGKHVKGKTGGI